jgi:hypothetical protein
MQATPTADWSREQDGTYTPTRTVTSGALASTPTPAEVAQSWWFPADGGDVLGDIYLDNLFYNSTYWHDVLDGGTAA